jgi:hypothetical protein
MTCQNNMMMPTVQHDRKAESIEAKVRWFQSLPVTERMDIFCEFTELALSVHPKLKDKRDVKPIAGRIQILSAK